MTFVTRQLLGSRWVNYRAACPDGVQVADLRLCVPKVVVKLPLIERWRLGVYGLDKRAGQAAKIWGRVSPYSLTNSE